jgi:hypothetical protein
MSANEARQAIVAQECAHMQEQYAARLVKDLQNLEIGFEVGRVSCIGLDGRRFAWEAYETCGLCGSTGVLIGADSKGYECHNCEECCVETFSTNYDGNDIRIPA